MCFIWKVAFHNIFIVKILLPSNSGMLLLFSNLIKKKGVIEFQNISLSLTNYKSTFAKYYFFLCPQEMRKNVYLLCPCIPIFKGLFFQILILQFWPQHNGVVNSVLFDLTYFCFIGASLFKNVENMLTYVCRLS